MQNIKLKINGGDMAADFSAEDSEGNKINLGE